MFKRAVLACLAVGVVMALAGCDASVSSTGTTSASGGSSGSATAQQASAKTSFALGEGIKVDDAVLTVVSAKKFKPSNEFEKPNAGKVYYIVNVQIQNSGKDPIDYNAFDYKIQDANGVQTDSTIVSDAPDPMNSGSLAPGGKLNANLVFEVPKDMKSLKLVMQPNFFSKQQVLITLTK